MLGVRGVRADAVFVHERDQVRLGQQRRRLGRAFGQLYRRRFEFDDVLIVDDFFVEPLLVDVYLEVIPLDDSQTRAGEAFAVNVDGHRGLFPYGVFGDAGQEVAHYQFVDSGFVALKVVGVFGWVNRRMGLI